MSIKPEYEACLRSVGRLVDDVITLEAKCRELRSENYKLRDQLARTALGDIDAGEFAHQLTVALGIGADKISLDDVTRAIAASKASPFASGHAPGADILCRQRGCLAPLNSEGRCTVHFGGAL